MKHDLHDYLKLGFDNPRKVAAVWLAILTLLSSLGYNVFNFMSFEPEFPVEISAKPETSVIEEITAPIKPHNELVIPTFSRHECKVLIDDAMKKHLASDDH